MYRSTSDTDSQGRTVPRVALPSQGPRSQCISDIYLLSRNFIFMATLPTRMLKWGHLADICQQADWPCIFALHVFIRVQIIIAVEEQHGAGTAQPELQTLCKQAHQLYANQLLNPFTSLPSSLKGVASERVISPRFASELDRLANSFNTRNVGN